MTTRSAKATHTLLLRLAGPMQSWGTQSRFTKRDTVSEPTKSGVIGLICAALGRSRPEPIDDLASLHMGVRVDREGTKERDYHTAQRVLRAKAKLSRLEDKGPRKSDIQETVTSERYYLADAHFIVGLEGDDLSLLRAIHEALKDPHWSLSLGRKAFVPGLPIYLPDGLKENCPLMEALEPATYPVRVGHGQEPPDEIRYAIGIHSEDDPIAKKAVVRRTQPDQPVSFQPRRFAPRDIAILRRPFDGPVQSRTV